MGLFDFFRSEKRGSDRAFLQAALGVNANAGVAVDENSALNFSAVWACVRVISEAIASLPINVYREEANGNRGIDKSSPIYNLIAYEPNNYMTSYTFS